MAIYAESLPQTQQHAGGDHRAAKENKNGSASYQSGLSAEDQESSLMNLSNTPINVGTNDQEVQIIKKCGNSTSSKYSSNRCRSAIRSSSSFDSTKIMINVFCKGNQVRQQERQMLRQKSMKHKGDPSAKSSVFNSNEKISSISFDSFSQYNNGQLGALYDNNQAYYNQFEDSARNADDRQAVQQDSLLVGQHIQTGYCGFEIFENYSDSLEIMEIQQILSLIHI